jgi:glycosyltransferase involved in cell wall biosynthesis
VGGGGAAVASALNEQLAANLHAVQVVTSAMKDLARFEIMNGVRVHRAPCWRRHRHYTTAAELATTLLPAYRLASALIRESAPEVIHAHFALPSGIVARALSARHRIPYVLTVHGSDIPGYNPDRFELLHRFLAPTWRSVMRGAAAVVAPSHFLAALIGRNLDVPVHVIPNGYNAQAHSGDAHARRAKRNLVLVVARLFPRKGVQHFIDAVAELDAADHACARQDWEMVVAGDGPYLPELRARAANVRANVRFAGFLTKHKLRELYEEARILVFPSLRENFPMVLLEGMDAGCAVITTDAEGCAEVIGDAGVVVAKGSAAALRAALLDLMNDPARCAALSARASARAGNFRWPRIANQYQDVFAAAARR